MDRTILVEKDIKAGQYLIKILDNTDFIVCAALWFYFTESDEWRLMIASPYVDKEGPRKSYEFIQNELKKSYDSLGDFSIPLKSITVLSPKDELIQLLKIAIRTGNGISSIRFTRNVINNQLIEDAYIYRLM